MGLENRLRRCWAAAKSTLCICPCYKHLPPTPRFVHRVDAKPTAFWDRTLVPSFLCTEYSNFFLEQGLRPHGKLSSCNTVRLKTAGSGCPAEELIGNLSCKAGVGLGTEFRSEKIPRNRLGMVSVIPRKKALIPRHSEFRGRANSDARNGTERNGMPRKRLVLQNISKIT